MNVALNLVRVKYQGHVDLQFTLSLLHPPYGAMMRIHSHVDALLIRLGAVNVVADSINSWCAIADPLVAGTPPQIPPPHLSSTSCVSAKLVSRLRALHISENESTGRALFLLSVYYSPAALLDGYRYPPCREPHLSKIHSPSNCQHSNV